MNAGSMRGRKDNSGAQQFLPRAEPARHVPPGAARVFLDEALRGLRRLDDQLGVLVEPREAQQRVAALALAQQVPLAAQSQVELGELESVVVLVDRPEARPGRLGEPLAEQQDAFARARAAADAAAQLVQLREAE